MQGVNQFLWLSGSFSQQILTVGTQTVAPVLIFSMYLLQHIRIEDSACEFLLGSWQAFVTLGELGLWDENVLQTLLFPCDCWRCSLTILLASPQPAALNLSNCWELEGRWACSVRHCWGMRRLMIFLLPPFLGNSRNSWSGFPKFDKMLPLCVPLCFFARTYFA